MGLLQLVWFLQAGKATKAIPELITHSRETIKTHNVVSHEADSAAGVAAATGMLHELVTKGPVD